MGYVKSSHSISSFRLSLAGGEPEIGPTVVWLRGEHDIATDGELRRVLACVIAANAAAIVVDLGDVEFMSASTLGVIVTARKLLRPQPRSLTVRSPSAFVRRIIGICGLDDLLGPSGQITDDGARDAPGPSVAAPWSVPDHVPRPVGGDVDLRAYAVIVERGAEMALPKAASRGGP